MGHFFQWGNHSSPSEILFTALVNNCQKNNLIFVETITERGLIEKLKGISFLDLYGWGEENLSGPWTMIYNKREKMLYAYFECVEDQMGFKLAWL